jgi:GT2 family glycosyltransferase
MTIAILLTTFNRKDKTIACLKCLENQVMRDAVKFDIYLTDDGSSDGTAESISRLFPKVHVFHGDGSLFWAGGMRRTWTEALAADPDYYLLLNDDTFLFPNAIESLIKSNEEGRFKYSHAVISIGATKDDVSGKISYGGRKLYSRHRPGSFTVHSETEQMECDLGNANIMLVPREIVKKIGILSKEFIHGLADFDYTLMAKKAGFRSVVTAGTLGTCIRDHGRNWKSADTRLKDRIKYMHSPKGLAYKQYLFFIRKHSPMYLPVAFSKLWMKTLFPFVYDKYKK